MQKNKVEGGGLKGWLILWAVSLFCGGIVIQYRPLPWPCYIDILREVLEFLAIIMAFSYRIRRYSAQNSTTNGVKVRLGRINFILILNAPQNRKEVYLILYNILCLFPT
jgi:hypothetical protein